MPSRKTKSSEMKDEGLVSQLQQLLNRAEAQASEVEKQRESAEKERVKCRELESLAQKQAIQIQELEKKIAGLSQFSSQQKEYICRLQKNLEEQKSVRNGFETSVKALQNRVALLDKQVTWKDEEIQRNKQQIRVLTEDKQDITKQLNGFVEEKQTADSQAKERESGFLRQVDMLQKIAKQYQLDGEELQRQLSVAVKERKAAEAREEEVKEELREAKGQLTQHKRLEAQQCARISTLVEESNRKEEESKQLRNCVALQKEELSKVNGKVSELEFALEDYKVRYETMQASHQKEKCTMEELVQEIKRDSASQLTQLRMELQHIQRQQTVEQTQAETERKQLETELQEKKDEVVATRSALAKVEEESNGMMQDLHFLRSRLKAFETEIRQAHANASRLEGVLAEREKEQAAAMEKERGLRTVIENEKRNAEQKIRIMQDELEKSKAEADKLKSLFQSSQKTWQVKESKLKEEVVQTVQLSEKKDHLIGKLQTAMKELKERHSRELHDWQGKLEETGKAKDMLHSEGNELRQRLHGMEEQLASSRDAVTHANATREEERKKFIAAREVYESTILKMKDAIEKLKRELGDVNDATTSKLSQSRAEQQSQAQKYQDEIASLSCELRDTKARETDLKLSVAELKQERDRLEGVVGEQAELVSLKTAELLDQLKEGDLLRSNLSKLEAKIQVLENREVETELFIQNQRKEIERTRAEHSTRVTQLQEELTSMSKQNAEKELEVVRLRQSFAEEKRQLTVKHQNEQEKTKQLLESSRWKTNEISRQLEQQKSENQSLLNQLSKIAQENQELRENHRSSLNINGSITSSYISEENSEQQPPPERMEDNNRENDDRREEEEEEEGEGEEGKGRVLLHTSTHARKKGSRSMTSHKTKQTRKIQRPSTGKRTVHPNQHQKSSLDESILCDSCDTTAEGRQSLLRTVLYHASASRQGKPRRPSSAKPIL